MQHSVSRWVALVVVCLAGGCTTMAPPVTLPAVVERQPPDAIEVARLHRDVEQLREQLRQFALLADEVKQLGAERQFVTLCHDVAQVLQAWHGAAATAQALIGTDAYPGALDAVEQRWLALRGASERLTEVRWLLGGRLCPASQPPPVLVPAPVPAAAAASLPVGTPGPGRNGSQP